MTATNSPSANKPYSVARVCEVWGVPRATFYDWRHRQRLASPPPRQRPGPRTGLSDDELLDEIRGVLSHAEDHLQIRGEGHRKVWARLRHRGTRTAMRRVLRVMRENALLAPTRQRRARGPRNHDGTIQTERPDEMWGTDATNVTLTTGKQAWVFIAIDHYTGECTGIHGSASGSRFEALEPIRQGVRELIGEIGAGVAAGLAIRHDHGSQYMSHAFQDEIRFLGAKSSPSYVASPEGNGIAERFNRTLKEQLLWVDSFATVEDLHKALQAFRTRYNANWLLARHGHRHPSQVRAEYAPQPVGMAA